MKYLFKTLMCCGLLMLITQSLLGQFVPGRDPVVVRKNIDDLTNKELSSYEFAIGVMKKRSNENPYDKTGFAWQAWVHNKSQVIIPESLEDQMSINRDVFDTLARWNEALSDRDYYEWVAGLGSAYFEQHGITTVRAKPGKCEHGTKMFLLWHRGEFYYYEQIIRDILVQHNKPLVGVPYWNYTQSPSGARYPRAFENEASMLFHRFRAHGQVVSGALSRAEFSDLVLDRTWEEFAGDLYIRSEFESRMHDYIHGVYVGDGPPIDCNSPSMLSTFTAAYDPIFFSFHAYIDYALDAWLNMNDGPTIDDLQLPLRAQQNPKYHLKGNNSKNGNMGRAYLYLESEKVGYKYEVGDLDRVMTISELDDVRKDMYGDTLVFSQSAISPFYALSTYKSAFRPEQEVGELISRNRLTETVDITPKETKGSYQVDVYVYPKNVRIDPYTSDPASKRRLRKDFVQKYFAYGGAKWASESHKGHHEAISGINLRLKGVNEALSALSKDDGFRQNYYVLINLTFNK